MKIFENIYQVPNNFTGSCKLKSNHSIHYFHCEKHHREDGPAVVFANKQKQWWYDGLLYGSDNEFTNKTWIEFVENLKRKEELKIFI